MYRDRTVLVTGHTGFKGSWMATWLHRLGAHVTGFAQPPLDARGHYTRTGIGDLMEDVEGDVRDAQAVANVLTKTGPEVVFHLAAQSRVRDSYADPKLTFDVNVGGTVNLLEAVRSTPSVRALVIVTSDKCYDNPETGSPLDEAAPLGGRDPYSASKGAQEIVSAAYRASFFDGAEGAPTRLATARAGNVIGGGDMGADRLIPDCVRALRAGHPVHVRNPMSVRPWQHVLDPLAGYLWLGARLLEGADGVDRAFNFGPDEAVQTRVSDLLSYCLAAWGSGEIEVTEEDAGPHEASTLVLSSAAARKMLGWTPLLDVAEAVQWTVDWYRADDEDHTAGTLSRGRSVAQIEKYVERASKRGLAWAGP